MSNFPSFSTFVAEIEPPPQQELQQELHQELHQELKQIKHKHSKKHSKSKPKTPKINTPKLYYHDTAANFKHITYGKVYGTPIPDYERFGDVIYGDYNLTHKWRINPKSSKSLRKLVIYNITQMHTEIPFRNRHQVLKESLKQKPIRIKSLSIEQTILDSKLDYIPLITNSLNNQSDEMDIDLDDFRQDLNFQKESSTLDSMLHNDPLNVSLWIKFINLQDKLSDTLKSTIKGRASLAKAINDRKISIFEKAFDKLPNNETLLVGFMKCFQESEETSEILLKWDSILSENPFSYILWTEYINYRKNDNINFTVSTILSAYEECIESISQDSDDTNRESNLLNIIADVCDFLSKTGYIEKAVAVYQAMIEFSLFCPPEYQEESFNQRMSYFEEFWEKDIPRFGQKEAPGWLNTLLMSENALIIEEPFVPKFEPCLDDDPLKNWYKRERHYEFYYWVPQIYSAKEDEIHDVYRTVLFDDILPFMADIKIPGRKFELIENFLGFLGAPMFPNKSSNSPTRIPYEVYSIAESIDEPFEVYEFPVHSTTPSFGTLYHDKYWFHAIGQEQIKFIEKSGANKIEFIRNIFEQGSKLSEFKHALEIRRIVLECALEYKSGRKYIKSVLKERGDNFMAWNAFCHLEFNQGNVDEARRVYEQTLVTLSSMPMDSNEGSFSLEFQKELLAMSFAEMELRLGNRENSRNILVNHIQGTWTNEQVGGVQLLKARLEYKKSIKRMLQDKESYMMDHILCRIMNGMIYELISSERVEDMLEWVKVEVEDVISGEGNSVMMEKVNELKVKILEIGGIGMRKHMKAVVEHGLDEFKSSSILRSILKSKWKSKWNIQRDGEYEELQRQWLENVKRKDISYGWKKHGNIEELVAKELRIRME